MVRSPLTGNDGESEPSDDLERANDRIRSAAKWLIASSAAVGAALIAGSQLSSIGKLDLGPPTSMANARLWVACVGAALGLTGVVFAIWTCVQVLLPKTVTIRELDQAWQGERPSLAPVVAYFRDNPVYLQGLADPRAVIEMRAGLIDRRATLDNQMAAVAASLAHERRYRIGRRRQLAEQRLRLERDATALDDGILDADTRIGYIEDIAAHEALQAQFRSALWRLLWATTAVALGIVAFAWAANPPAKPAPQADLRGTQLIGADLRDADLRNARLDAANLSNADLTGADVTGATISGVVWRSTICPDGSNSDADRHTCAGHLARR